MAHIKVNRKTLAVAAISMTLDNMTPEEDCEILWILDDTAHAIINGHFCLEDVHTPPYPALMCRADINRYRQLACMVPRGGIIVEVGSRWGGSAKAIADVVDPSVQIHCIDLGWANKKTGRAGGLVAYVPDEQWIVDYWGMTAVSETQCLLEWVANYLSPHSNVHLHALSSPYEVQWWDTPIDMLFEDSIHKNPQLHETLQFWVPLVKSGGIIAGHDYNPWQPEVWPDVLQEANELADRLGTQLFHDKSAQKTWNKPGIWWLIKP